MKLYTLFGNYCEKCSDIKFFCTPDFLFNFFFSFIVIFLEITVLYIPDWIIEYAHSIYPTSPPPPHPFSMQIIHARIAEVQATAENVATELLDILEVIQNYWHVCGNQDLFFFFLLVRTIVFASPIKI